MGPSLICDYRELEFPYWSLCYAGKDYLPSLTLLCGINYSTCKQIGIPLLTFDNVQQFSRNTACTGKLRKLESLSPEDTEFY
jgi:hypothetical protein